MDEIGILVNEYGAKEINFLDPVFGLSKHWTMELCNRIRAAGYDIEWSALTRVDLTDETLLLEMRRSGCWMLYYGIEAGNEGLLKNIKKNLRLAKIRESVGLASKAGIRVWGSFMFGLPGENPELAEETVAFAKSLPLDFASFHLTTPFPGTELWDSVDQWGYLSRSFEDFTQLRNVFIPHGWKGREAELQALLARAFKEFYMKPPMLHETYAESVPPRT